ncbi:MAG: ABC transporter substrate-binding protein [Desulfotignum sp.]|nr:ABC transporter substrate-binding protein [Desulfotignum sp.]MCF8089129.1 ABC transporter substrate-binding protein [Desulfotignum sp.]MCF8138668.1 ABC transporter substrate-binding protein [Desulfotignum sp.]
MGKKQHPAFEGLKNDLSKGKINRREFIRYSAVLGISAAAAAQLTGLSLFTKTASASTVRRGGTFKIAGVVTKVTHPAQISWITPSNQIRQIAEYLTYTDHENITHPYLLKNWEVSSDLKTWTLNLRPGILFNNGDKFIADDVVFSLQQWLDKTVGSSMKGMLGGYLSDDGIEKVNDLQVKLHLKRPEIGLPEHLFHFPALILNHRTFEGDFIKAPHGTGPYTLESYVEGERCLLKRRNDYWKKGVDGDTLPYMDAIEYIDMGSEASPMIVGLSNGDLDCIDLSDLGGAQAYTALKGDPNVTVGQVTTNATRVMRMRVDMKPWSDNRVRQALKFCHNREKILALAYFQEGLLGQDTHVSPKHPEYAPVETPAYNPEKARQLLKEAGYPNGLEVNMAVGSGWSDIVRYAEILQQDAKPGGFKINIQIMPNSQYWEKWTEVDLGVTGWTHRPIGTMVLNLAYNADEEGKPVPWNESRWVDKEFIELLGKANGTLDVEKRREIFAKLEKIQQERGSISNSYWLNQWMFSGKRVQNVIAHPNRYLKADDIWLNA